MHYHLLTPHGKCKYNWEHGLLAVMKGTKVPNPRRSSACDCTCVLTRLSRDSLMLAMRIVLFLPMQSSLTSFWHSFTGLVQLIFSFPRWSDSTAPIRFIGELFSLTNYTLLFLFGSKDKITVFTCLRFTGTAALHSGHTFGGGILTANGELANMAKMYLPRTKWLLATWSRFIHMRVFRGVKNGWHIM